MTVLQQLCNSAPYWRQRTTTSPLRCEEEALDTLRLSQVDLVITEALLPGMDGFELVRQIRANEAWTLIPIIMLTVRSAPRTMPPASMPAPTSSSSSRLRRPR
jgi:CheY-like chemotaxis protein